MPDFFKTYFIDPIYYNTGYNIVNTAAFAVILIVAVFLTYKLLKRMQIKIDAKFFLGVIPFIALGGIMRAYEDLLEATGATHGISGLVLVDATGTTRNLLLISPIIYVMMFFVALIPLLAAIAVEKYSKISYWKTWFVIGIVLDILVLSQLRFSNAAGFELMVGIALAWFIAIFAVRKLAPSTKIKEFFTNENTFILDVHMFDATTTFVSLNYFSYFEQHVLPGFLIDVFGPWIMFVLKLVVVSVVLYLFDKELKKESDLEKRTFLKIVVLILGMGPGIRNFLRLVMGV